jgi:hypothetical protein
VLTRLRVNSAACKSSLTTLPPERPRSSSRRRSRRSRAQLECGIAGLADEASKEARAEERNADLVVCIFAVASTRCRLGGEQHAQEHGTKVRGGTRNSGTSSTKAHAKLLAQLTDSSWSYLHV